MAAGEGIITRKDIITDDALAFGTLLAEQAEISIKKIEELKKIFKELKSIPKDVKNASDFKDLNVTLEKNIKLSNKYIEVLNKQISLERTIYRLKKSSIANEKSEAKVKIDNANALKAEANARKANAQAVATEANAVKAMNQSKLSEINLLNKVYSSKAKVIRKTVEQSEAYKQLNFAWRQAQQNLAQSILTDGAKAKSTQRLQREFNELDKKVKQVDAAIKNYSKNVGNYSSAFSGLGGFTSQLAGALGWAGALTTAVAVGRSIYNTTKELEGLYKAMELGSKSTEDYTSNLKFLDKITEDYGLELISTTQAYNKFYLASKNKLSIQEIQLVFDKVSKSASIMGMTVEQQEGTFKALADMMSKGTVMAEELKGQLGDRIPVAVEVMAKALGVGTEELLKMMQNGEVMAAEVLPKFAVELEKAVGADQITKVENLTASEVRLKNEWTDFVKELNGSENVIGNVAMWFLDFTTEALQGLNRLSSSWESLWNKTQGLNFEMGVSQAKRDFLNPKWESEINRATKKRTEFLALEKKELDKLSAQQQKYNELNRDGIFKKEGFRTVAKEIEQTKANLGQIQGYLKQIDTFLNSGKENTTSVIKGETDAQRKKREAAERKAKRDREKAQSDADKAEEDGLKKAKKAYEDQINLKIQEAEQQADINKRISQDEKSLFENRLSALAAYQEESENALRLEAEKKIKSLSNFSKDYKALTDEEVQTYLKQEGDLTKLKDDQILIFKEYYFQLQKLREENKDNLQKNAEIEAKIIAANTAALISGNDINRLKELSKIEEDFKNLTFKNNAERVKAVEKREKDILAINRKYDKINLQDQIKQMIDTLLILGLEGEKIIELKKKLAELQNQILKSDNESGATDAEDELKKQKENIDKIRQSVSEFSQEFADVMGMSSKVVEDFVMVAVDQFASLEEKIKATFMFMKEFSNSVYQQRIDEIQHEIDLTQEKNDRELENFTGTEKEKERLRIKQRADEEKLEAKKRREQEKQANLNKAFAIAQTIWNTSSAIMKAYELGPIVGTIFAAVIGTLGAIQINRIASTKVPKYKKGRKGGPEELAIVGDGGVSEVVESKDGSAYMTPDTDTLVKLNEGDTVHKSVDDYHKSLQKAMVSKMSKDTEKYLDQTKKDTLLQEKIEENTREIKALHETMKRKKMSTTVNLPKIDLAHAAWFNKNK